MSVFKRWNGAQWETIGPGVTSARFEKINNMIAPEFDPKNTYDIGDYVVQSDKLYRCINRIGTPQAWNSENWREVKLGQDVTELRNDVVAVSNTQPTSENNRIWVKPDNHDMKIPLIEDVMMLPNPNDYGENDQIPRSTGNGIEWVYYGTPSDEQAENAINAWLNAHPEATTTVQNNSLTPSKFKRKPVFNFNTVQDIVEYTDLTIGMICHTNGFYTLGDGGSAYYEIKNTGIANNRDIIACGNLFAHLIIDNQNYVTPEMFGAYGDGEHDDIEAFKSALNISNFIFCNQNKEYLIGLRHEGEENYPIIITRKNVTVIGHFIDGRLPERTEPHISCAGAGLFHLNGADGFTFIGSIKSNSTLPVGSTTTHYIGLQNEGAAGISIEGDIKNLDINIYGEKLYAAVYNGCWGGRGNETVRRFNGTTGLSHSNIKIRTNNVSYPFASNNCENNNINIDAVDTHRAIYLVGGRNNYINIKSRNYYNVVSAAILLSPSTTTDEDGNRINLSCNNNVINYIDTGTTVAPRGHGLITFGGFGAGVEFLGENPFSVSQNVITLNGHINNGQNTEMGLINDVKTSVSQEIIALLSFDNIVINNLTMEKLWDTRIQPYAVNYKLRLIDNVGKASLQIASTNENNEINIEGKILLVNIINNDFNGKLILTPLNNNVDISASNEVTTPIYINGDISRSPLIGSTATRNKNIKKFSYNSIISVDRTQE